MGSGQGKGKAKGKVQKKEEILLLNKNSNSLKKKPSISSRSESSYTSQTNQIPTESAFQIACGLNKKALDDLQNLDYQKINFTLTDQQRIPYFQCPVHSNRNIELINTNPSIQQTLFCYECAFEQGCVKELIKYSDFFNDSNFTKIFGEINNYEHKIIYNSMLNENPGEKFLDYLSKKLLEARTSVKQFFDEQQEKLDTYKKQYHSMSQIKSIIALFQEACKTCVLQNQSDMQTFEKEISSLIQQQLKKRESLSKDLIACRKIIEDSNYIIEDLSKNMSAHLKGLGPFQKELAEYMEKDYDCFKEIVNQELIQKDKLFEIDFQKQKDGSITITNPSYQKMAIKFNHKQILCSDEKYQIDLDYEFDDEGLLKINDGWEVKTKNKIEKRQTESIKIYIDAQQNILKLKRKDFLYNLKNEGFMDNEVFSIQIFGKSTLKVKSFQKVLFLDCY